MNNVSDADPAQVPLSLLVFECSGPCVNAVQRHVNDARVALPFPVGDARDAARGLETGMAYLVNDSGGTPSGPVVAP